MILRGSRIRAMSWVCAVPWTLVACCLPPTDSIADDRRPRFEAKFENGDRVLGNQLKDWPAVPKLDDRSLFSADNSLLWIRDRRLRPQDSAPAFVELVGGDRLVGCVIRHQSGSQPNSRPTYSAIDEPTRAHFVVNAVASLYGSQSLDVGVSDSSRIDDRFVLRIVWEPTTRYYERSTVFLRDGVKLRFRSIRWEAQSAVLLLDEGARKLSFAKIAEIHMPQRDPWQTYWEELARMAANEHTRLVQLETVNGNRITATRSRFRARSEGGGQSRGSDLHGVHPAWSLDALWVRGDSIWMRRSFAPHNPPLSRLVPGLPNVRALRPALADEANPVRDSHATLGQLGRYRTNRNVQNGLMRSAGKEFGWGFGIHAPSELRFPLPACAREFHTRMGLDRIAGTGGCVRARVYLASTRTRPIYESPFVVGSQTVVDSRTVRIPSLAGLQQLILEVDAAHPDRPTAADPFNIRDLFNWLEPLLRLDKSEVQREISKRRTIPIIAWRDWKLDTDGIKAVKIVNHWDARDDAPDGFRLGVVAADAKIVLARTVTISDDSKWLVLFASRDDEVTEPPKVAVRIDGKLLAQFAVPSRSRSSGDATPIVVPLRSYLGQRVKIEVVQISNGRQTPVIWDSLRLAATPPSIIEAFEDEGKLAGVGGEPTPARLVGNSSHAGKKSIRIDAPGRVRLADVVGPIRIRRSPALGEFRYLRLAFRKYGGGRFGFRLPHDDSASRPVAYDTGIGKSIGGLAKRVWRHQLPEEWIVLECDIFHDFGEIDITGLTFDVPDGEYALVDHVYFARTPDDFGLLPGTRSPEATNQIAREALAKDVLAKALRATVAIQLGDRWASGIVISPDGDILTAGHVFAAPGTDVLIHWTDGKTSKAKTKGIHRNLDIGLVKIAGAKGRWPHVAIGPFGDFSNDQFYLAISHRSRVVSRQQPVTSVTKTKRFVLGSAWTTFDREDYSSGGPLLNPHGDLVGIQTRRSRFGGFLYSPTKDIGDHLQALRDNRMVGNWSNGVGPITGAYIRNLENGCNVVRVLPDSSAKRAGLRAGDVVKKIDGQAVVTLVDIYGLLSDKNPADHVEFVVQRGDAMLRMRIELMPRVP